MSRVLLAAVCLALLHSSAVSAQGTGVYDSQRQFLQLPLARAWAHHDHELVAPRNKLFDALDEGFCGIYADFALQPNGQMILPLLTGNLTTSAATGETVQTHYLEPLAALINQTGYVYESSAFWGVCETVVFYADVMNTTAFPIALTANRAFDVLHAELVKYQRRFPGLFTVYQPDGTITPGPLTVLMSGVRPDPPYVANITDRLIVLNGRTQWVDNEFADYPLTVWPQVGVRAAGAATALAGANSTLLKLKPSEEQVIQDFVARAHAQGRVVRLTQGFPAEDVAAGWGVLLSLGSDIIHTQDYKGFRGFTLSGVASVSNTTAALAAAKRLQVPARPAAATTTGRRLRRAAA